MSAISGRRRTEELGLGVLALVIVRLGLRAARASPRRRRLPPGLWGFLVAILGLFVIAHLAVRRLAPRADATLLPLVATLLGIGFVTISRLDLAVARVEAGRADAGGVDRGRRRRVRRHAGARPQRPHARPVPYTFLLLGVVALLLPLVPGVGVELNEARLWVRLGPLTVQPGEAAKVLLVVFFAAYLVEKRELLSSGQPPASAACTCPTRSTSARCCCRGSSRS